ncbi:MAG: FkbM family methyltransferase [Planctomycetota bacterium]|nr:FkbM family methyltransferase [Planctomycetota bacterium]
MKQSTAVQAARGPELFEFDAYTSLARILPPDGEHVFVDAGSNVGTMAQRMLDRFPRATVHAFEPVAETFEKLRSRFAGSRSVVPVRAALGASDGEVDIRVNGCPGTSSVLASHERAIVYHGDNLRTRRVERVRVMSLDGWAHSAGIERVDFLKIDVQGYELEVLKGAERLLRSGVVAVYSEAQMTEIYEGAAMFSDIDLFLRGRGFELFQVLEIFSGGVERRTTCCDALWVRSDVLAAHVASLRAEAAPRAA